MSLELDSERRTRLAWRWHDKRVLVTGAGGFIGSHLTEQLVREGAQVRAFVHYNSRNDWGLLELLPTEIGGQVEVFPGELTDAGLVRQAVVGCDVVFHLGALIAIPYSYQAPRHFIDTNVVGTAHVLQACLEAEVAKVVQTSTSEVYGTARYTPIDEDHPLQAQSPYAASKIAAEKLAESFYCAYGLPVAILRPFNTFGPRQSARAVIPAIISQALTADTIKLGLLTPIRDLMYVADTVAAFMAVAASEQSRGHVFNAGTGRGVTIGSVAEMIVERCGGHQRIVTDAERLRPPQSEVMALICDSTRAREGLGWSPRYTLEQGLAATVAYMREHLHHYKPDRFNR